GAARRAAHAACLQTSAGGGAGAGAGRGAGGGGGFSHDNDRRRSAAQARKGKGATRTGPGGRCGNEEGADGGRSEEGRAQGVALSREGPRRAYRWRLPKARGKPCIPGRRRSPPLGTGEDRHPLSIEQSTCRRRRRAGRLRLPTPDQRSRALGPRAVGTRQRLRWRKPLCPASVRGHCARGDKSEARVSALAERATDGQFEDLDAPLPFKLRPLPVAADRGGLLCGDGGAAPALQCGPELVWGGAEPPLRRPSPCGGARSITFIYEEPACHCQSSPGVLADKSGREPRYR
ncbi:hypothetical protein T492DRAFT_905544, partial [Pavlovales sp. CCMP2436]